jgi:hypothetical protein
MIIKKLKAQKEWNRLFIGKQCPGHHRSSGIDLLSKPE